MKARQNLIACLYKQPRANCIQHRGLAESEIQPCDVAARIL
jgi:hypothetical protein